MGASQPRAFTALVNPISGGGRAAQHWTPLAAELSSAGSDVTVELTRSQAHAVELATEAARHGQIVVAVGGDGLVRDAAEGVCRAGGGVLAVVPAGRGNDLARGLGIPHGRHELAQLLLHAPAKPLDVIDMDGTIVPGNVYCGIDSVANRLLNTNRWMPGALLYRVAPVQAVMTWRPVTFTLTLDGEQRTVRAHSVVVGNTGWYGRGLHIVPSADPSDGRLDVLIVGEGPRRAIASYMKQAKTGAHVKRPEVQVLTAREVTIAAEREVPVGADGEDMGVTPAHMAVRPAALSIIAP